MISDKISNETVGGVMAGAGATGGAVQTLTEFANLIVLWGNAALVICGLILMAPRLWRMLCRR
jgi:sulfite exporter TauE/SafE